MTKSIFIIILGHPGSGKSYISKLIATHIENKLNIKINGVNDMHYSMIDNLVENDEQFINLTSEFIRNNWNHTEIIELSNNIDSITDEIIMGNNNKITYSAEILSEIYYNVKNKMDYDKINDNLLTNSLQAKRNIIFETTGRNNSDWLFNDIINKYYTDYTFVLVYLDVDNLTIIKQTIKRFIIQCNKIFNGESVGVRLPPLNAITKLNSLVDKFSCDNINYILSYDNINGFNK